jgi:hypothetical protein
MAGDNLPKKLQQCNGFFLWSTLSGFSNPRATTNFGEENDQRLGSIGLVLPRALLQTEARSLLSTRRESDADRMRCRP